MSTVATRMAALLAGGALLVGVSVPGQAVAAPVDGGGAPPAPTSADGSADPSVIRASLKSLEQLEGRIDHESQAGPANAYRLCGETIAPGEMACMSYRRADLPTVRSLAEAQSPAGWGPVELRTAYNLPTGDAGAGQTVAITVAFDYPDAEADLNAYREQYGLPPCTSADGCFRKVDQRGGTDYPIYDPAWAGEAALDMDMVSAICPRCRILLVEADDNSAGNMIAAVDRAVLMGARFVSNSWGGPQDVESAQEFDKVFDRPGVAFTVSTGDRGYEINYPAYSRHVTSVGGTSLYRDAGTPRGWREQAWTYGGGGCAEGEPKPPFQRDADCPYRMMADVSAVADPYTGVAVYHGGWQVFGGTSASAPIVAGVYALAGAPRPDTPANSYPYANPKALHDVTEGANASCGGSYLCTAQPGYDGPTGLGTPNGLAAFAIGPRGTLGGTVTDAITGQPVAGAAVTAGDQQGGTDAQGRFAFTLPPGEYTVTASAFGYDAGTVRATVTEGATTTADLTLTAQPRAVLSGTLRDGAGQGWPLYGSVQVRGQPSTKVFTDPGTGRYRMSLPAGASYTLDVQPLYTGYAAFSRDVTLNADPGRLNLTAAVVFETCDAPGYAYRVEPTGTEAFEKTPEGWTLNDFRGTGLLWRFDDPLGRGNRTGGTGGFASADIGELPDGGSHGTSLTSPAYDLTGAHPVLTFRADYAASPWTTAQVYAIRDGVSTQLWYHGGDDPVRGPQTIDLTPLAGQTGVRFQFTFQGLSQGWWQVDDVVVGERSCAPRAGGLVQGQVSDLNTGAGLPGATVTRAGHPDERGISVGTPDDPGLGEGRYVLFAAATGAQEITATAPNGYRAAAQTATVVAGAATPASFALPAGRIAVSPGAVGGTVTLGGTRTTTVTVRNTGSAPARVHVHDAPATTVPEGTGAPLVVGPEVSWRGKSEAAPQKTTPHSPPWTSGPDYPIGITENAAAVGPDGTLYSAGGVSRNVADAGVRAYALDPAAGAWRRLPDMPHPREAPQAAVLRGKLYVTGGVDDTGLPVPGMDVYDPATGRWSAGAAPPSSFAASSSAVLNGQWHVVGGCPSVYECGATAVRVFDPVAGEWGTVADYPVAAAWLGCGALDAALYCAGGVGTDGRGIAKGYRYQPDGDRWTPIADLPDRLWGMGYSAAGGRLLLSGGALGAPARLTNAGWAYDPAGDAWSSLPNANQVSYGGGSACGLYRVGGSVSPQDLSRSVEILPGFGDCAASSDVSWLSAAPGTVTLAPGESTAVTVTLDASAAGVTQPGVLTAGLTTAEDTPYPAVTTPVTMTVRPPASWGLLTGTVTGTSCGGQRSPIAGAALTVLGAAESFTLTTGPDGRYALWLDAPRNNPLTIYVAKDGWTPARATTRIVRQETTTVDLALVPDHSCG
jgi:hypothetical protein